MSGKIYIGQAGTGKTTRIICDLKDFISKREWKEYESVLAITFMNGSRKRLHEKLKIIRKEIDFRFKCATIDSFSLALVNRFRKYLDIHKTIYLDIKENAPDFTELSDYEIILSLKAVQEKTINLLENKNILEYLSVSYPIIIIDEFQDCRGYIFEIIKRLSNSAFLLLAADPFQQLFEDENFEAIDWVKQIKFDFINLDEENKIWRTSNSKIINSAYCLRTGNNSDSNNIKVFPCPSHHIASALVTRTISYNLKSKSIAIISPTKEESSPFVRDTLSGLKKSYHNNGPYYSLLYRIQETEPDIILKSFSNKKVYTKKELVKIDKKDDYVLRMSIENVLRKMSLRNSNVISKEGLVSIVDLMCHNFENFIKRDISSKLVFTTIHGAKNREYDTVIVLWSTYKTKNFSGYYQRKLLYNAITRAKKNAIVIVQHKNNDEQDLKKNSDLFNLVIDNTN